MLLDICSEPDQRALILRKISSSVREQLEIQNVVAECCQALSRNGLRTMSADQERSLDIISKVFEARIEEHQSTPSTCMSNCNNLLKMALTLSLAINSLLRHIARLSIQVFGFYKSLVPLKPSAIAGLYSSVSNLLDAMESHSVQVNIAVSPLYLLYGLLSASYVLVRLIKTPHLACYIDANQATALLLQGITLAKQMSLNHNDTAARMVVILTDLRDSNIAFKNSVGMSGSPALRIRGRLVMSHALDVMLYWKEEFGRSLGPYPTPFAEQPCSDLDLRMSAKNLAATVADVPDDEPPSNYLSPLPADPLLTDFGILLDDGLFSSIWGPFSQLAGDSML